MTRDEPAMLGMGNLRAARKRSRRPEQHPGERDRVLILRLDGEMGIELCSSQRRRMTVREQ